MKYTRIAISILFLFASLMLIMTALQTGKVSEPRPKATSIACIAQPSPTPGFIVYPCVWCDFDYPDTQSNIKNARCSYDGDSTQCSGHPAGVVRYGWAHCRGKDGNECSAQSSDYAGEGVVSDSLGSVPCEHAVTDFPEKIIPHFDCGRVQVDITVNGGEQYLVGKIGRGAVDCAGANPSATPTTPAGATDSPTPPPPTNTPGGPSNTPTPTPPPGSTATPTSTPTPIPSATSHPPTNTPTNTATPTNTPTATPTNTPIPSATQRPPTNTPTQTPTRTPTNTPTASPTRTPTRTPTPTSTPSNTRTPTPTTGSTGGLTNTPTPPSGSIAPSTQPPRCDLSCGPCGWRGTDNVCRDGYPPNQPPGGLICCISGTAVPPSATPTTRPGQPTNTLAPGQPTYTLAPGQPTYTPTPSGPTSTPTPYPLVNGFRCDQRCGICGISDAGGVCQERQTLPDNSVCCHNSCVSKSCAKIFGIAGDECTSEEQCLYPTQPVGYPASTTPTPPVSGSTIPWFLITIPAIIIIVGLAF